MDKEWIFDIPWAQDFTRVRQAFAQEFLGAVRQQVNLASALDVGCGVGYFSKFLSDMGLQVVAVDGRTENTEEGKKRYPEINFIAANIEDPDVPKIGAFDLVFCVGLLYHLENPFRAIRNLHSLTAKVLLIETMCVPTSQPTMELLDEGISENQGLNYVAFYPSEACLIKMLYRAGFPFVYRFGVLPADELFRSSLWRKQQRTFIAGSKVPISAPNLLLAHEPYRRVMTNADPWTTNASVARHHLNGLVFEGRVLISRFLRPIRRIVGAKPK